MFVVKLETKISDLQNIYRINFWLYIIESNFDIYIKIRLNYLQKKNVCFYINILYIYGLFIVTQ